MFFHRILRSLLLVASLETTVAILVATDSPPRPTAESQASAPELAAVQSHADLALARTDLADYRGWIKFLRYEAETAVARHGAASAEAAAKTRRLAEWLDRIDANPRVLATLQSVQEWAYESPADGSGQPFKIAIPTDYDPARPAPLSVYMHGYSGNHLEHSTGMVSHPGAFEVAVLGRSRGGGYRALSEADVLHVIDYIQAHWAIDPGRIHLNGGSMGGLGTYRLGSRYPQRFASGRPSCGVASFVPIGNLLTFPIYATHSADDPVVSILHERGPLARLRELGGQVIFDETNGYGHAVWNYAEGNRRGVEWEKFQVRPASRDVRHIDYTALDGGATRGWWAEIAEWGDDPKPARFVLTAGANNTLHAELTNIAALRLRLAESPFDATQPLNVSINGAVPITLAAPLPTAAFLARGEKGWSFEPPSPPAFRLHTPGSASLLYDGEPLLIVYGTHGTAAETTAMRSAAESASKSPNPAWLDDSGDAGADGVPHSQNLYGRLNTKPDSAVTDADIARCHLVLIGTAAQNSVVARLVGQLPVRLADGSIACSDGFSVPSAHRSLGLVHYNPLAPDRLIFWVASDDPKAYAAGCWVPQLMGGGATFSGTSFGGDFVVAETGHSTLVIARSFDSRWKWVDRPDKSPLLPASAKTQRDFSVAVAAAIRRATGADFAIVALSTPAAEDAIAIGTTRVCDVEPLFYHSPMGLCELSGTELAQIVRAAAALDDQRLFVFGSPALDIAKVEPTRRYLVAMPADALWAFAGIAKLAPPSYRVADIGVGDAIAHFLSEAP